MDLGSWLKEEYVTSRPLKEEELVELANAEGEEKEE
jgi:endogenous inhibitor of DNA gyrase (YacG/DUF329 family)